MTDISLPPPPALEPADTFAARHRVWWEACDILLRTVGEQNRLAAIEASRAHAQAQAATAEALAASVTAQHALASAVATAPPARQPTRAEMVFELLKVQPQATMLTNGQLVAGAAGVVDAFVMKYPGAVSG